MYVGTMCLNRYLGTDVMNQVTDVVHNLGRVLIY